jgi:alginate O-acetyltransferase complex protein AlgJ
MDFDTQLIRKKLYHIIFAFTFLGISIIPALKPGISIRTLENSFFGHEKLIEAFNTLRMRLGDRVFPNVIIGEDGWLYYTAAKTMNEYQGSNPYTPDEMKDVGGSWDALAVQLKQKGIKLIVIIAPDKNTIYPEYLPKQIEKVGSQSRLDQFVEYMDKYGKAHVIDIRPDLIEASKTEQVYYKTDTHWNPRAEYITYQKIMSALSHQYPELEIHPYSDYEEVSGGLVTFGIPRILGMPYIQEEYWSLRPKFETGTTTSEIPLSDENLTSVRFSSNKNQNLPSMLIYHDSFFVGVVPLLEPHFRQITSIPNTPIPGIWNIHWVDQVHPDIVIIEGVERYINEKIYLPTGH